MSTDAEEIDARKQSYCCEKGEAAGLVGRCCPDCAKLNMEYMESLRGGLNGSFRTEEGYILFRLQRLLEAYQSEAKPWVDRLIHLRSIEQPEGRFYTGRLGEPWKEEK